jgi:hypothetical protein
MRPFIPLVLLLSACSGDPAATVPSATISSHANGDEVIEDDWVTFSVTVSYA